MTTPADLQRVVDIALAEDLGLSGDITTLATVPQDATGTAYVVSREGGVLSGDTAFEAVFRTVDPAVRVTWSRTAGDTMVPGDLVATVTGSARPILTAERSALNLLGHLTGIASRTADFVQLVDGTDAQIIDTRKTTPGLRALEKQAVLDGGGANHRFGLFDAILVKDNHIGLGGGLHPVLQRLAECSSHMVRVEVEVDTLDQLRHLVDFEAQRIAAGKPPVVHAVLLDNMTPAQIAEGVRIVRAHPAAMLVEASGGVNEQTVADLAHAGPDLISIGALTHSVRCHDFGLDLQV